jgi:hypothetical protein
MTDILKYWLLAVVVLSVQPVSGSAEIDNPAGIITENLKEFSKHTQPQKVYLHLDKTDYYAGETIWFKAYLFDGLTHLPDTSRNNLYIELISSSGEAMEKRLLLAEEGFAAGDIRLSFDIPDGNYILRAYTDWMRNFDDNFFYTRHLYIVNDSYANSIPRSDVRKNKRFNRDLSRKKSEYMVDFFPEGGHLLADVNNRVAFRVSDMLGRGRSAEGEVVDDRGNPVAGFSSDSLGIGVFEFLPEAGITYKAGISIDGNRPVIYELPEVKNYGYTLQIEQDDNFINLSIIRAGVPGSTSASSAVDVIGHLHGVPFYSESVNVVQSRQDIRIEKAGLKTGIAHFAVFDSELNPVAERMVFIESNDRLNFSPRINTVIIDEKEYIDLDISVMDINGDPVVGEFSFSAVTGRPDKASHDMNIVSHVKFSSDLGRLSQDPWAYTGESDVTGKSADILLLTHEWTRFDWNEVISGYLPEMPYSSDPGISISGRLVDPARNETLSNYPLKLEIKSGYDNTYEINTGRNGLFSFDSLFYEGTVEAQLSSERLPGDYAPRIILDIAKSSGYDFEPGIYTRESRITSRGDNWSRASGISDSPYQSSQERNTTIQLYGTPDQTIYIDYDSQTGNDLYDVLRRRASGINFEGGRVTMRGASGTPMFKLDGTTIAANTFFNLYPMSIERIEIFRGPSTSIFGVQGGAGVIVAYSRRAGYSGIQDETQLSLLGFHRPRDYSEVLSTFFDFAAPEEEIQKTVYWSPDLRSDQEGRISLRFPLGSGIESLILTIEGAGIDGGIGFAELVIDIER